eukprot:6734099-Pyramimonas_sp.AAC.1
MDAWSRKRWRETPPKEAEGGRPEKPGHHATTELAKVEKAEHGTARPRQISTGKANQIRMPGAAS